MSVFYTYLWLREDGTVYYVGKGHGNRAFRKGCPSRDLIIVQEHPCEADAFAVEMFLMAYYGRKDLGTGILRNRTDGGEGTTGFKHLPGRIVSEETRRKLSIAKKGKKPNNFGKKVSAESREKMRIHALGNKSRTGQPKPTEEGRKISATQTGKKHSKEWCESISKALKGRSSWSKGKHLSAEHKAALSAAHRRVNANNN